MKDAEPTIERLLAGLRDAEPQPGIERRVLEMMQARKTVAPVPFWRRVRPQTIPAIAFRLASALIITGAFVAIVLHLRSRVPVDSSHPPSLAVRQESPTEAIPRRVPVRGWLPALRVRSKHSRTMPPKPDLRAASFPAPPLHLTEQEKLLLRVAHRRNPEDTAILNPAAQAAQSAKANDQFQQFFRMNTTEMRKQIE
jgi:hypothetical protein